MNFSQRLFKILEEDTKKNRKYEYGCAMLHFEFPELKKLHAQIKKDEIYEDPNDDSFGLEKEAHITLLFGLHDDETSEDEVFDICTKFDYEGVTLTGLSLFKNEKYEVLKFDVEGKDLHAANKLLMKLPHTTDYPVYHPHTTVAYILPGKGQEIIDRINQTEPYEVTPIDVVYSKGDRTKATRPL